ncbi:hypothetical protein [Burkholderia sp. L27(2015)]|uniref:hypothetical protein n=1 Tax=Burkholderia sp. L27(2015) TaxID=1641858 RepID=UPI00131E8AAA|nr:hypothetical protein [Burkholderia sp. L27(2015)]
MKPLLASAAACAIAATFALGCNLAVAQQPAAQSPAAAAAPAAPIDANEAAGLPNLNQINRPAERGSASATVDLNVPRVPSFHEKTPGGTEITEYRDRGKATEIDVHSGIGTNYQMTSPVDTSPKVQNNGPAPARLPSVTLKY